MSCFGMRMVEKASVFTPGVVDSTRVSSGGEGNLRWVCAKNVTLLLILQLILVGFSSVSSAAWDGVILTEADFQALQAFKHELNDPRGFLTSWNDSGLGACSGAWEGLKCAHGQVIVIQLPWRGLGGRITEKIGQLQALRKLSLHDNFITGPIPIALGFLQSLRGLQLFNNRLFGSIPASIGSCRLLQNLDLSNNLLTGSIPASLDGSTKLYRLNLSHNALSGPIPASLTRSVSLTLLSLEHNNLSGPVPDTWGSSYNNSAQAAQLLEFSVSHNQITGVIPEELSSLSSLRMLDLSYNVVNGSLPVGLSQLKNLTVLNLRSNLITGRIPSSIGNLSSLTDLDLSLNNLSGLLPESLADLQSLNSLNVSYNHLSGAVPLPLTHKFNSSSFAGNLQLCGYSKETACPTPPPSEAPSQELSWKKQGRKIGTKDVILVAAGILLVILVLLCCILIFCLMSTRAAAKKIDGGAKGIAPAARRPEKGAAEVESGGEAAGGKLVHFDGPMGFTADDLLCATAEIMGKSTYGTVYKATLEDGSRVAVKRLREKIARTSKDFEAQVNVLGRFRHPNLLALRAYYLGPKAEKLLVFDLMTKGSLAAFLHARGPDTPVNWQTRMNIAQGMTRGLLHLHTQENIIHGNLTSTNVLLDETSAKIADYGLSRLMTSAANSNVMATAGALGYRAPELSKLKKASTKTDVYSLGVIILELLTGKSPGEAMDGVDLPQWVASIVKEEWTTEVFDLELMRDAPAIGDELLSTLKLALHCVDPSPSARPEVVQVLQQLEEIRGEMMAASSGDDFGAGPSSITH